jgi:hypothetical protein
MGSSAEYRWIQMLSNFRSIYSTEVVMDSSALAVGLSTEVNISPSIAVVMGLSVEVGMGHRWSWHHMQNLYA